MEDAAPQTAAAAGDALCSLLHGARKTVEDFEVVQAMEGAGMSSEDEQPVFVQLVGWEGSDVDDEIQAAAAAAVDPPSTENLENPISAQRGRGGGGRHGRGRTLGLTGQARTPPEHQLQLPKHCKITSSMQNGVTSTLQPHFPSSIQGLPRSHLCWRVQNNTLGIQDTTVRETNKYVREIPNKQRPPSYNQQFPWPPKWVLVFPQFTEAILMLWLAFLLWIGLHKTTNEDELFSTHWIWERPSVSRFFSRDEHRRIKAALHCQDYAEMERNDVQDCEGRPVLCKIGFLMDHMTKKCSKHYWPGTDIVHKPIGAGIQFWVMAESHQSKQYLYDCELDSNDNKVNKVQNSLMLLVKLLPPGSKNYRIAADNLFNSVDTCRKVAAAGHRIYGTICMDQGVPEKMKQKMGELKHLKGNTAFVQISADDLTLWAWMDSKVVMCILTCTRHVW
eukprot:2280048-Rhodomonas_salina.1